MTRRLAKTGLSESNGKNRHAIWGDFQAGFARNAEIALTFCHIDVGFPPGFCDLLLLQTFNESQLE